MPATSAGLRGYTTRSLSGTLGVSPGSWRKHRKAGLDTQGMCDMCDVCDKCQGGAGGASGPADGPFASGSIQYDSSAVTDCDFLEMSAILFIAGFLHSF